MHTLFHFCIEKNSFYLFICNLLNCISPKEFYTTILKFVWKFFNVLIITFIQQGCIKCIKSDSKTFIMLEKICIFQINSVLLNFLFNRKLFLQKIIWSSTTVFNTDNNQKCLLSTKSVYYNDLWRSCDSEAENTAAYHRNILHYNIYSHYKNILQFLLYFWPNKCSLGEQNKL